MALEITDQYLQTEDNLATFDGLYRMTLLRFKFKLFYLGSIG